MRSACCIPTLHHAAWCSPAICLDANAKNKRLQCSLTHHAFIHMPENHIHSWPRRKRGIEAVYLSTLAKIKMAKERTIRNRSKIIFLNSAELLSEPNRSKLYSVDCCNGGDHTANEQAKGLISLIRNVNYVRGCPGFTPWMEM